MHVSSSMRWRWAALGTVAAGLPLVACLVPDVELAPPGCDLDQPTCESTASNAPREEPPPESPAGPDGAPQKPANASATDDDSGAPDAAPRTGGPKPAACLSEDNACFPIGTKCGCALDCCAGLFCTKVGARVETECCAAAGAPCTEHADCCGAALCKPDGAGKQTCQD